MNPPADVRIRYDAEWDITVVVFRDAPIDFTVEAGHGVLIDIGEDGRVVSAEISGIYCAPGEQDRAR